MASDALEMILNFFKMTSMGSEMTLKKFKVTFDGSEMTLNFFKMISEGSDAILNFFKIFFVTLNTISIILIKKKRRLRDASIIKNQRNEKLRLCF